jgi:dTDP-glucose 4,6-dehydratase
MNIGNPHELSMVDLARLVARIAGSNSDVVFVPRPVDDPTVRQPDITMARETLGWRPLVPVEEGLRRTVEYFRAHAQVLEDVPAGPPASLVRAATEARRPVASDGSRAVVYRNNVAALRSH